MARFPGIILRDVQPEDDLTLEIEMVRLADGRPSPHDEWESSDFNLFQRSGTLDLEEPHGGLLVLPQEIRQPFFEWLWPQLEDAAYRAELSDYLDQIPGTYRQRPA